jgi:hypothetical protein
LPRRSRVHEDPAHVPHLTGSCKKPERKDFYYEGYPVPMPDMETQCTSSGGTFAKEPA